MWIKTKKALRRFAKDTEGNMSIEALFFVPLICAVLAATFSYYDAFRYKALNVKAANTISDALSRETDPINNDYLDGMVEVLEFLTRSDGDYSLRVTMVVYKKRDDIYKVNWSKTRGDFSRLRTADLESIRDKLPVMLNNERVIVVETLTEYQPPLAVAGLESEELFYNFAFTRPRFAPKLVWSSD